MAALEEDDEPKPTAKPTATEAAKKPAMDESEKEELLLDLEDELDGLMRDLSKAKQKVGDAEDLLADVGKDDEEMLEQAETELIGMRLLLLLLLLMLLLLLLLLLFLEDEVIHFLFSVIVLLRL
jgi:hypothetical protein